jgi:hypothetical protein
MDGPYVDLTLLAGEGTAGPPTTELAVVRRRLDELVEERWLCGLTDREESQYRQLAAREEELLHLLAGAIPA